MINIILYISITLNIVLGYKAYKNKNMLHKAYDTINRQSNNILTLTKSIAYKYSKSDLTFEMRRKQLLKSLNRK
jgi:hypothetical protein